VHERRDFFQGGTLGDFSKIILGVAKTGKILFFPLETKKTTFFAEIFKIQGVKAPLPPLPTPMMLWRAHYSFDWPKASDTVVNKASPKHLFLRVFNKLIYLG